MVVGFCAREEESGLFGSEGLLHCLHFRFGSVHVLPLFEPLFFELGLFGCLLGRLPKSLLRLEASVDKDVFQLLLLGLELFLLLGDVAVAFHWLLHLLGEEAGGSLAACGFLLLARSHLVQ